MGKLPGNFLFVIFFSGRGCCVPNLPNVTETLFKNHTLNLIIELRFIFFFFDTCNQCVYVNYNCQLMFAEHSNLRKLSV